MPEKTDAQKRAQKRYMEKTARVEITMAPDKKKRVQDHAQNHKKSVNEYINDAINEKLANDDEKR